MHWASGISTEAAKLEEGSLGDKVGFVIYDNGEMVITGSGAITQTAEDIKNKESVTSVVFKDDAAGGVTEIGEAAFYGMVNLKAVTLPKSLKTIGNIAFAGCRKLSDITIPETAESIGAQAFAYTALKEITVPDSVKILGEKAFEGCAGLEKAQIGRGVKQAVPGLFKDCKALTELTIPDFETEKADYGEYGEGPKVAVKDMFNVIDPLNTECSVSKITILDGAEKISPYEFSGMSSLKEVVIPDTVTAISEAAFSRCVSIERIVLPAGVKSIGSAAFAGCVKLSDIVIPAGTDTIEGFTFAACEKISEISLPEGTKTVGTQAFAHCYGLTDIYIPASVKKIDEKVFEEDRLKDIWFGGSEAEWKAAAGEYAGSEDLKKVTVHFDSVSLKYTKEEAEKLRGCGDVDGSGKVDLTDLSMISLYNIGDYDLSGDQN
ncbi:leucine-rich repeat protein [Ruminococcus sp. HUN007]|uniref:leucine-rich repeat protein n=1 Tax=Ruminococcus sp. HUN007 TaxID=1514668 RepID=UPI0005D13B0B|nr:leucine-rich repeat protein [Ruminococcus sp. HUN007]